MTSNATFEDLVTLGRTEHPRPPHELVGALQDSVHREPVRLVACFQLPRRAPRCCHLDGAERCPRTDTVEVVDGDLREPTYACDEHRGAYAGEAWPVGSG